MEKVQFQQEQMLPELKDLVQKGVFSKAEIRNIMRKRTAFERSLIRRIPKKGDFLRYIAFEMDLESLRRKRVDRLKLPPSPPSVSDYALVRRQFYIFERALKKFKSDVSLWIEYINVAKEEGARTLVGRVIARALQLHPTNPALYILAASHELAYLSPSTARSTLQRGIRLNEDSVEMWTEYVKMELGFIENLRRRWEVLGVSFSEKGKTAKPPIDSEVDHGDRYFQGTNVDGDEAREEVMKGAIIVSVMDSAVEALPKLALFEALRHLLSNHPSPEPLRKVLLDHLYSLLVSTLPNDPGAIKMYATRFLTPDLREEGIVDKFSKANEDLLFSVRSAGVSSRQDFLKVYAEFAEDWIAKDIDSNLKLYLLASVKSLIRDSRDTPSSTLLCAHLRILTHSFPSPGNEILDLARRYTTQPPSSDVRLWLQRLALERKYDTVQNARMVWRQARLALEPKRSAGPPDALLLKLWLWGLHDGDLTTDEEDAKVMMEELLCDSLRKSSPATLHEELLLRYVDLLAGLPPTGEHQTNGQGIDGDVDADAAVLAIQPSNVSSGSIVRTPVKLLKMDTIRKLARDYTPSTRVWRAVFSVAQPVAKKTGPNVDKPMENVLEVIYGFWREGDIAQASLAWAWWLLRCGRGKDANNVVLRARSALGFGEARDAFEAEWKALLNHDLDGGDSDGDAVAISS